MTSYDTDPQADGSQFRAPVLVLALLTITAGFADGYALQRFDVFVANQSGNVVRIGMGLVGEYAAWDLALLSMCGFAVGGMLAWLLNRAASRTGWPLIRLRLATVLAAVAVWWLMVSFVDAGRGIGLLSAFVGAVGMGVMASVLTRVAGVRTQPTYQSATVLSSAQGLLDWLTDADPATRSGRSLALLGALTLVCYALGGALGAVSARSMGADAILLLLLPLLAAVVLAHRSVQQARAAGTSS